MANTYCPDSFVIVKLSYPDVDGNIEVIYKIVGGWSSSYAYGSSWRMNSGIAYVDECEAGYYEFYGYSGSCYRVHKDNNRVTMAMSEIIGQLDSLKEHNVDVEYLTLDEFLKEFNPEGGEND